MGDRRTVRRAAGNRQQSAREHDPQPHGRWNERQGGHVTRVVPARKAPTIVAYRLAAGASGTDLPDAKPGVKEVR
jgi:hypothetical protein